MIEERQNYTTAEFAALVVPEPDAKFYFQRLLDLHELEKQINGPDFPIKFYDGIPMEDGECSHRGLRYGINHGIFGCLTMLDRLGFGMEARAIITFYKEQDDHRE